MASSLDGSLQKLFYIMSTGTSITHGKLPLLWRVIGTLDIGLSIFHLSPEIVRGGESCDSTPLIFFLFFLFFLLLE